MNTTPRFADSKAVIAYLAEKFPQCFVVKGEAKPLKIGVFQDLAERLSDEDQLSKTQLRVAIRHYTTSWRYLRCIKDGQKRVDLDGNEGESLTAEHIQHAKEKLAESQARAKQNRAKQAPAADETKKRRAPKAKLSSKPVKPKAENKPKAEKAVEGKKVDDVTALSEQQRVEVLLGKAPMKAVVLDINKDDVRVQLDSGMIIKVKPEHLFAKS